MQRYAGLGIERYCWREGSVIDDLRYVHGFGIERNSSARGVQVQSIRQRSRALTFRFSWGGEFGGGPASAGPPPKFPEPSVVMFPTFYGHSRTLSGQTHLFVSQNRVGDGRLRAQSRPKPASQKVPLALEAAGPDIRRDREPDPPNCPKYALNAAFASKPPS